MNLLRKDTPFKIILISLVCAVVITYPNIAWLPWELGFMKGDARTYHLLFFAFRYLFFGLLIWALIKINLQRLIVASFKKRFLYNIIICLLGYGIFIGLSFLFYSKPSHFGSILLFQYFVLCFLSAFAGHIYQLYLVQKKKEQEIKQLKVENLQSRYDALTNQVNPHFFFNSLNGLTSLVRKKNDENTLAYINKMSDVFRYILQSDKKGLVTLEDELEFVNSFRYMMEVRFANKLQYDIDVCPEVLSAKLPVLSILPLLDNVVVHNMIDSDHKMVVSIRCNEAKELVVVNPIYPKLSSSDTNGTGLKNLENRFALLINKQIRIEDDGILFRVYLPLK